ncbi:MAG: hypothetical protein K8I02_11005, partial [Candidatus Methylomirabilis sp.]|nr:hypothetical protein [Deltaproteobacteria bacterium]
TDSKRRFHDRDFRLRALESRLHSACSLDGKFMLFRRDLAPAGIPAETLVDDYELTFMVVARGERCVVAEDAVVYEGYPETAEDDLRQIRRRTAQGLLMAWRHGRFAFNPRYGAFGLWTYPFRRFLIYYLPFLLAYEALWIVLRAPFWGTLALAAGAGAMAWTGRTYPFVLFGGMLLGWWDLATGRGADFGRGGVWSRSERSA